MPPSWDPSVFPNLLAGTYDETSKFDTKYNCIAFAAGDDTKWWEPVVGVGYYWPPNVPMEYTVDAYIRAYEHEGFQVCADNSVEAGFEKIALYASMTAVGAVPTHAALQLPDGRWKSKCGQCEDIAHDTLDRLNSQKYGSALVFMKRPRKP
jgi:hypothetical protein